MTIWQLSDQAIEPLDQTSFAVEGLSERGDLQRLLRDRIEVIDDGLYVLAEEFGNWEDSQRRIDLLCIDRDAKIVVVELKRTDTGGHSDLQALRYAAMVSTLTFGQAVQAHGAYLRARGLDRDPLVGILNHLGWDDPDEEQFRQR